MNLLTTFLNALPGAVAQGLIWGIMAIGVYITYRILDVADLTVDGSICTGAAVCTVMVVNGTNVWIALTVAFIVGMLTGLLTGVFHTSMGIPAILAGILTQLILWSVNLKILGKANLALPSRLFKLLVSIGNAPKSIWVLVAMVLVIIGTLYWFFGTQAGTSIRATGNNLRMSAAQGINNNLNKIFGLMLSNGIVAFSGAMLAQYQGFADINMGRGAIVIGLAAVIIGEALFSRIARNFAVRLMSVAAGGVVYYIVYQIVIILGFDTDLLKMLSATLVAIFLAVPYWKKTYFTKRRVKGAKTDA